MSALSDCDRCKKMNPAAIRQEMGCGFEPPIENPSSVWQPPCGKIGYSHDDLTVCAGYLANLPEVVEVGRAWVHWEKGQLEAFTRGQPTETLVGGIETMDVAISRSRHWAQTPESEGGGAK